MNSCVVSGRLTKNPEVKYSQGNSELAIAKFSVAVNRRFKNKEGKYDADFFDVTCFGKVAEWVEKNTSKGMKLEISGRLQQDRWTDKDGNNRSKITIVAEQLDFAESKSASQNSQSQEQSQQTATQSQSQPQTQPQSSNTDFMNIPDGISEELPFN